MERNTKNIIPVISARLIDAGYPLPKKQLKVVLKDVDLDLCPGELMCLIGSNGSGKSTLIKTLSGILEPIGGHIEIAGMNSIQYAEADLAKVISIVLTEKIDADHLSVRSLIALGRYPYTGILGKLSAEDELIVDWAVKVTGLSEFIERDIRDISDGERQKVMIARALAQQTRIIFLDEPTAYLDMQNKYEVMSLLRKLSREEGKAILLSTHDLDLALQFADKICITSFGHTETGTPEDLMLNGSLEKIFDQRQIRFNINSGSFFVPVITSKEIGLKGEEPLVSLTRKALEREGYGITMTDGDSVVETFTANGVYIWRVNNEGKSVELNSIASLLNYLRDTD
jgi:iron complex transport system ATP-binding protein